MRCDALQRGISRLPRARVEAIIAKARRPEIAWPTRSTRRRRVSIVLDTNVLGSGLLQASGPPGRILDLVLSRTVRLALDERIFAEYCDVLARPEFEFPLASILAVTISSGAPARASSRRGWTFTGLTPTMPSSSRWP